MEDYSLRLLQEDDLAQTLDWRNRDDIRKCMINDKIISWDEHVEWFDRLKKDKTRECLLFFMQGKSLGIVNLFSIDEQTENCCEWGFYIGEPSAPRGAGLLLGYAGLEYAFHNYRIDKIKSGILAFNERSVNFHKRLFFQENGVQCKAALHIDGYHDLLLFELDKDTWEENKESVFKYAFDKIKASI